MASTITMFRGFKSPGVHVWSPFVNKLETRFRLAGLSYRVEPGSPLQAPRGKIPYISIANPDSGDQPPTLLGDSTLIIEKLEADGLLDDLNSKLSPVENARDLALRALLEDRLYFYQNYERWHVNYYTMRPGVLWAMPYPVQVVVGLLAYRKIASTLSGQGTMRYSYEEIGAFRRHIWESIDALLTESRNKKKVEDGPSDSPFWVLGGDGPSEVDATVFGFVSSALVCTAGPDSMKLVKSLPNVVEYAHRIHQTYFPDYTLWD
ncbi:putative glutathione S-transferase [Amylocarpus encephaloides]|uniref:Glutathione S-transferase n=1 Tax=Amylocarpus encephaloides TaxID=45428 RepID=A0A9P7YPI7_9HELO|nr:putative glutathione S-transferase [Amylocarpus encephaloides]